MNQAQAIEEVLLACRELVDRGLIARTWGNVSCRIDDKRFAITPSGIDYGRLTSRTIVVVDRETLTHEGSVKPSSEKGIHAAAYSLNPRTSFVIHSHQAYASCLSVAGFQLLDPRPEEREVLGGDIGLASYGLPGTKSLRKKVAEKLTDSSVILMERHGALLTGQDRQMTFDRAILLEELCMRALGDLRISRAAPQGVSQKESQWDPFNYQGPEEAAPIHQALQETHRGPLALLHRQSALLENFMARSQRLPALLDDFAQIVGSDIKQVEAHDLKKLVRASRGRNAVLVKGLGAFCFAGTLSDAQAILTLVEKNALVYLNADRLGKVKPLPFLDRKLMRLVYTQKYAKMK